MSRFAQTYEDPDYEYQGEDTDTEFEIPQELGTIVDGWVRITVAEKQQIDEEFGPFITINS